MKDSTLYKAIKRKINESHPIFMCGSNGSLIPSSHVFIKESKLEDAEHAAYFCSHDSSGLPEIHIFLNDPMFHDYFDRAVALVHEYGHFLSWQHDRALSNRVGDAQLLFNAGKEISEESIKEIMAEEKMAWSLGRKFLKNYLPAEDPRWRRFNNLRQNCINSHKVELVG